MALRWRHTLHLLWGLPGAAILLALLLVVSPFILLRQRAVRDWTLDRSRVAAIFSGDARIRIDRVTRLGPSGFNVGGLRVENRVNSTWQSWLRVGGVEVRLRPGDLLSRKLSVSSLTVDSVTVDLTRAPVPLFAPAKAMSEKGAARPLRLPAIRCGSVVVREVLVLASRDRRWHGELELSGLDHTEGRVRGTLRRAAVATVPDTLFFALEDGLVEGELVTRFGVSAVKVSGPGLRGRLDGGWQAAAVSPDSSSHVFAELGIGSFTPVEVSLLRALHLPFGTEDHLAGRITTHLTLPPGAPPYADLSLDLTGFLFGTGLDTLLVAVTASPDRARLDGLNLRCGEMALRGAASVARPGTAAVTLQIEQVDLSAPPISTFAPGLPASRFSGTVRAEADSLGPRVRLRAEVALEPGELLGRPLSGLSVRARLDPQALFVDDLRAVDGDSTSATFDLHGRLDRAEETLQAEGTLRRLPLEDWVAPWLDRVILEGRVSGPFQVRGTLRHPLVSGDFGLRAGRAMEVYLDTLHVGGFRGSFIPLRLSGDVTAAGLDVYKVGLDSLRGPITIADTIRTRMTAFRDSMRLDLLARIAPYTRGAVLFDSLTLQAGSAPTLTLDGRSRLDWAPDRVRIDSIRIRSAAGVAWGGGRVEPRPGQGGSEPFRFRTWAEGIDLGAIASFLRLPSENLSGSASGEFSGEGTIAAPTYQVHVIGEGVTTYDWFWDRIELAGAAGEGIGFRADSLRVRGSGYLGPLPGIEQVGPSLPGPPLLVRGDALRMTFQEPWAQLLHDLADPARAPEVIAAAALDGRLDVRGLPVAPLLAPALGARGSDRHTNVLNEALDPMLSKIEVVRPATGDEAARRPSGIGGSIDLTAGIGGTGRDVEVDLDLVGRGVWVYQAWADSVRLRASARNAHVIVDELRWQMGETDLEAKADLGLRLSANPPMLRDTGKRGWIEADLHQADLALLSLVTGVIQDPVGRLDGKVRVEVLAGHPRLSGKMTVRDGAFRIPGREERFSRIDAGGVIDSLGMHVEATGRLNQSGKVVLKGLVRDVDDFDLTAKVEEAPVFETGNYRFLAEADLRARTEAEGDSVRPHVTGTARVLEGLITQDLSKPPARLPPKTPWLVDLEVEAPGNLRLNQPYTAVDLGQGRLNVSFRWPYWNLSGSLEVLGGTYRLFNRNLRITSGTVTFEDTGQGPNPKLDVVAETKLTGSVEEGEIHVTLNVTGYPAKKELEISLTGIDDAGKSHSEAELIERMSLGQVQSAEFGSFSSADPTRQALSSELVGQIERQLVGQLPWVDRVQLEGQFGGDDPFKINVRPIVQPQWSVLYSQELSASPEREVSVRYRLSNLLFLNAAVDRRQQKQDGVPPETYTLDLKIRFDY